MQVRPARSGDEEAILEVLRASLGESAVLRRTPELWRWKHEENPFGHSLVLVAEVDDQLAGVRAVMRWELVGPAGLSLRCGRMVDTATHPGFQRMGIFSQLTARSVEQATDEGIDLIFNTPNEKSGSGYLKMGWQRVGDIGVMIRPSHRLARRLVGGRVRVTEDSLPEATEFVDPARPPPAHAPVDREPRGLRTPRTDDYLRWRYTAHPTARYVGTTPGSSSAVARPNHRRGLRELVVSDLLGPAPGAALADLVGSARADYLVAWFSRGSPERRAALRSGLIPVPGTRALTLVARPLRQLPVDVFDLGAWDLALGDLELL